MTFVNKFSLVLALLLAPIALVQDTKQPDLSKGTLQTNNQGETTPRAHDRELNFRAYAELLRKDMKMQRTAIINEIMKFDADEATTFWPIFRQYDAELIKLADTRVDIIDDYV